MQARLRQQLATSDQQRDLAGDGHPPRLVHRHEVLLGQPLETGSHRDGGGAPGAGRQHCARVGRCQFQPVVEGPRVRNSQPDTGLVGAHDCLQATGFGAHDLADGRRHANIADEVSPQQDPVVKVAEQRTQGLRVAVESLDQVCRTEPPCGRQRAGRLQHFELRRRQVVQCRDGARCPVGAQGQVRERLGNGSQQVGAAREQDFQLPVTAAPQILGEATGRWGHALTIGCLGARREGVATQECAAPVAPRTSQAELTVVSGNPAS